MRRRNPDWRHEVERTLGAHGFDIQSSSASRVVGQDRLTARDGYHSRTGYDYTPQDLVRSRTGPVIDALRALGFSAIAHSGEKGWVEVEVKAKQAVPAPVPGARFRPKERVFFKDWSKTGVVLGSRVGPKGPQYEVALDNGFKVWWDDADTIPAQVRFNPRPARRRRNPEIHWKRGDLTSVGWYPGDPKLYVVFLGPEFRPTWYLIHVTKSAWYNRKGSLRGYINAQGRGGKPFGFPSPEAAELAALVHANGR